MPWQDLWARRRPPEAPWLGETRLREDHGIARVVSAPAPNARCPDWVHPAARVHGRSLRTWADLPWATTPVALLVWGRRFCGDTPTCGRQPFPERCPIVAPRSARTPARLRAAQTSTGLAWGGAAGARHRGRQGVPGSRRTLLRRGRSLPAPEGPPPHGVGLDDGAWRQGPREGARLVALDRGCPLAVREVRQAAPGAAWGNAPPDVSIGARARAAS